MQNIEPLESLELEIDIKNEDQIFVDDIKEFENNYVEEIHDFGEENHNFAEKHHDFCASDNETDVNFVADKEFESDDSLPLEVTRKKKKKEGKRKRSLEKETVKKVRKKVEKKPAEPKIDRRRKPFLNQDLNETLFTVSTENTMKYISFLKQKHF